MRARALEPGDGRRVGEADEGTKGHLRGEKRTRGEISSAAQSTMLAWRRASSRVHAVEAGCAQERAQAREQKCQWQQGENSLQLAAWGAAGDRFWRLPSFRPHPEREQVGYQPARPRDGGTESRRRTTGCRRNGEGAAGCTSSREVAGNC